jgi:hypothetical protein
MPALDAADARTQLAAASPGWRKRSDCGTPEQRDALPIFCPPGVVTASY